MSDSVASTASLLPLLAFGAHPDDIEFGVGAVIARETAAGRPVHFVVCSRGEAGTHGTPAERTLEAEETGKKSTSEKISGAATGGAAQEPGSPTEMGVSATAHGRKLLELGFSVDQVVHDYGDLCQAITDLAVKLDAPFGVDEFRTLNRCLDNAIADAVSSFSIERDSVIAGAQETMINERLGFLVHELRNALSTAHLSFTALEVGSLPVSGATGSVLKRSLASLKALMDSAIADVRTQSSVDKSEAYPLKTFIAEAAVSAELYAHKRGCTLKVEPVSPSLCIKGSRERLQAALANPLQNAFKYTHEGTEISLAARGVADSVHIDISDRCGGLTQGALARMFTPFAGLAQNKEGLGLGLSIARQSVEDEGGTLTVRDVPGVGCVFTMKLPRFTAA